MDSKQDNVIIAQEDCDVKETTLESNKHVEESTSSVEFNEEKMQCCTNIPEVSQCNGQVEGQARESSPTNEHSYASVNSESPSESDLPSSIENNITSRSLNSETVLPTDVLVNIESNELEQNENNYDSGKDDIVPSINNEVVITEEIITVESKESEKDTNSIVNNKNGDEPAKDLFYMDTNTSLGAIAQQYDSSDSENENSDKTKNQTKISNDQEYRNKEIVITSDGSSDSESDSSSSDSESDSDSSVAKSSKSNSDNSDEDDPKPKTRGNRPKKVIKQKGEFDDLPPIEDLKISVPEVLCDPLGEIAWTVDQMVVVRPKPGKPTLNLDTVLFIEKGQRALGHIFDVFGQVTEPHYCVRFNSSEHIRECDVKVGMTVYYCPNTPYTSLVFLSELTKMKAVDDLGEDEPPQFSDDEEEQAYLASLKNKSNKAKDASHEPPNKRRRGNNKSGWQANHPWNSNREQQNQYNPHNPHNPHNPQNQRPFYRTHHPWSRPRYQPRGSWNQYNSFPNNQWMGQYSQYNEMQAYNEYVSTAAVQPIEMQNVGFSQAHWNAQYHVPQVNTVPLQGYPQTLVPPFTLPPPPPPPPPPNGEM